MDDARPALARRPALAVLAVCSLVLAGLAWWLVPWEAVPGGRLSPMPVGELFAPDEVARAERFSSQRRLLGWSAYAVSLLVAAVLGLTPLGARLLRGWFGRLRWWVAVPLGAAAVLLVGRVLTLPFSVLLRRQNLESGLTDQAALPWLRDQATSFLVGWVTTVVLLLVLVGCARRWPRHWYAAAGSATAGLVVAGSYLYPVLVEPLFNDFAPMPAGELRSSVLRLATDQGVEVSEVLVADASQRTTTLNAYVSGFGDTRRVVVYDTLLEAVPAEEARIVIAHEIAHARYDDVLVGTALGALAGVAGVALLALLVDSRRLRHQAGVRGPGDPAAVALVLALVSFGTALSEPAVNLVSRAVEVRADRDSLAVTGDAAAFVAMQRQLALRSLSDPTPPAWSHWWFGSHPTTLQRAGLPASLREAGR